MPTSADRVVPLQEMIDFDVVEGDPDVRGWEVVSGTGIRLGAVEDLLVDLDAMKVRYLDVDLASDPANGERHGHVLIPIDCTALDETLDRVTVAAVDPTSILTLPRYDGEVTVELEQQLLDCFNQDPPASFCAHLPPQPGEII